MNVFKLLWSLLLGDDQSLIKCFHQYVSRNDDIINFKF